MAITNYCECDNTHEANNTVCQFCYEQKNGGRIKNNRDIDELRMDAQDILKEANLLRCPECNVGYEDWEEHETILIEDTGKCSGCYGYCPICAKEDDDWIEKEEE